MTPALSGPAATVGSRGGGYAASLHALTPARSWSGARVQVVAIPVVALCLAGAALAVPFGSVVALPIGPGALTVTPLLLALGAVPWLLGPLARRRLPSLHVPVLAPLAVFVACLVLAAWWAPDLARSVIEIARWGELGLALVLAAGLACGRRGQRLVLLAVLVAGTAEAALGLWWALQRIGPESFAILGGRLFRAHGTFGQPNPFGGYMNMVWPIGAALAIAAIAPVRARERQGGVRAAAVRMRTRGPEGVEQSGGSTASAQERDGGAPSAVALARVRRPSAGAPTGVRLGRGHTPGGNALSATWAIVGLAAAAVCGLGLVLSWSRGAWLAAACAAGAMGVTWLIGSLRPPVSRRAALVMACAALALGCAVFVGGARLPGAIGARLASVVQTFTVWGVGDAEVDDAAFATIERVAHWEAAAAMWSDRPWLGQGPGHFEVAYAQYRLPRWPDALGHAHNAYLHLLAESGLIGLAGYLVFFLAAVRLAARAALRPASAWHGALGLGLVGVLAALAFHSLVDYLFVHDLTVHLGLLLGLTVAAERAARWRTLP